MDLIRTEGGAGGERHLCQRGRCTLTGQLGAKPRPLSLIHLNHQPCDRDGANGGGKQERGRRMHAVYARDMMPVVEHERPRNGHIGKCHAAYMSQKPAPPPSPLEAVADAQGHVLWEVHRHSTAAPTRPVQPLHRIATEMRAFAFCRASGRRTAQEERRRVRLTASDRERARLARTAILSATSRSSFVSRALHTSPMPPAPSLAVTAYGPIFVPGLRGIQFVGSIRVSQRHFGAFRGFSWVI